MNITIDERFSSFALRLVAVALIGVLQVPALAELATADSSAINSSSYTVLSSTAAAAARARKLRRARRHVRRYQAMKRLQAAGQQFQSAVKKSSPNPNHVQGSRAHPMPADAPTLPQPTPPPPAPAPTAPPSPPPSGADRFFQSAAKVMTKSWKGNIFVWLPAISTDPNAGPTYGLMPVVVLADPSTHHIKQLFAPSYTYNGLFGQTGTFRYYYYPTDESQLYSAASLSQHTNRELKTRYEDTAAWGGILYLRTEGYYNVDGSPHFYGLGPNSRESDESGYVAKDAVARASVGLNFENIWRATVGARFRRFSTDDNIIPNTLNLTDRFPNLNGEGTLNTASTEFHLIWDTRDSPITPSHGASGDLFVEKTAQALGSDSNYVRYGAESAKLFPWQNSKQITVVHGLYEWANGPNIPFYELPSLGGRDTLRGYGDGRFEDRGRAVLNIEQRITFASLSMMGIQTNFEVAPFFDLGTVFPTLPQAQFRSLRPVYGGAFRAAVKPNVVGDVEVGVGNEGPAVFVDINYPY